MPITKLIKKQEPKAFLKNELSYTLFLLNQRLECVAKFLKEHQDCKELDELEQAYKNWIQFLQGSNELIEKGVIVNG